MISVYFNLINIVSNYKSCLLYWSFITMASNWLLLIINYSIFCLILRLIVSGSVLNIRSKMSRITCI